ncbi:MAG: DNA-processing protein DprA [Gammaproteobacteria bacterium]|nr:DNA-processing protein DprA [Gammaproteobacteria bacterium]
MEAKPWITLQLCPALSPLLRRRLLERYGHAQAVIAAPGAELLEAGLKPAVLGWLRQPDPAVIAPCLEWLAGEGAHLLPFNDERFPPLLREIDDPPAALFVLGQVAALAEPQLAIVGSRSATPLGRSTAMDFSRALARSGLAIVSGLAEGIDAAAHEAALECGGITVGVCATGLDRVYPRRNEELARRIIASGALISENPPGIELQQWMFPRRNRIISGMSAGVLVVEAAARSGARITARAAAEQGREVFAVPGSIHSPQSRGCHALIRAGAKLVERPGDVLEELPALLQIGGAVAPAQAAPEPAPGELPLLGGLLRQGPMGMDELARRTGLDASELSAALTRMELEGRVHSLPGGRFQYDR